MLLVCATWLCWKVTLVPNSATSGATTKPPSCWWRLIHTCSVVEIYFVDLIFRNIAQ